MSYHATYRFKVPAVYLSEHARLRDFFGVNGYIVHRCEYLMNDAALEYVVLDSCRPIERPLPSEEYLFVRAPEGHFKLAKPPAPEPPRYTLDEKKVLRRARDLCESGDLEEVAAALGNLKAAVENCPGASQW